MATGYPAGNGNRRQSNGSASPYELTQHYGMHSFQTAGQMQQYMEQIAGEGATVNVTHAVWNSTSRRFFGSGSSIAQPWTNNGQNGIAAIQGVDASQSQPLSNLSSPGRHFMTSPRPGPVPNGSRLETIVLICDLHHRNRNGNLELPNSPSPLSAIQRAGGQAVATQCEICGQISLTNRSGNFVGRYPTTDPRLRR